MNTLLRTVDDLVDALGGTKAVAELTGVTSPAVSNWRAFREIPPAYFVVFLDACEQQHLRFDRQIFGFHPAEVRA